MSHMKVNWSAAPNFEYGLAARKFTDALPTNQTPIAGLDLSSIVYLQNSAEIIQMAQWFLSGDGFAENVVFSTYLHEFKLPTVDSKRVLTGGEIRELWLSGPSVTAWSFNKLAQVTWLQCSIASYW